MRTSERLVARGDAVPWLGSFRMSEQPTEPDDDGRPGVGTVVALVCIGIVGIVWGLVEVLWGRPALGLFAILGFMTVCGAVHYYLRVARHLDRSCR